MCVIQFQWFLTASLFKQCQFVRLHCKKMNQLLFCYISDKAAAQRGFAAVLNWTYCCHSNHGFYKSTRILKFLTLREGEVFLNALCQWGIVRSMNSISSIFASLSEFMSCHVPHPIHPCFSCPWTPQALLTYCFTHFYRKQRNCSCVGACVCVWDRD